jgi:hypothetical protein
MGSADEVDRTLDAEHLPALIAELAAKSDSGTFGTTTPSLSSRAGSSSTTRD